MSDMFLGSQTPLYQNVCIRKRNKNGKILEERYCCGENIQIDFVGVCTGICVISNALLAKAALEEAQIRVIANACACVTPESHRTALEAMKMCQIEIVEE